MNRVLATTCAALIALPMPTALAQDKVTASNQQCVVSSAEQQAIQDFWDDIEQQARAKRIQELDTTIPHFAADLARYDTEGAPIAGELQQKLTDAKVPESLAELSNKTSEFTQDPEFQTTYTYEQTVNAAASISEDPATAVAQQLREKQRTRLDEIRITVFDQQDVRERYNARQLEFKQALEQCADEIAPPATWPWYAAGGALVAALIAARAWWNSRKPNRHSKAV